jgi:hypothetical protein
MLAACDASRGTAIVSSGIQVDDAAVDFSDPFGGCQITTSSPGNDIFPLACSQRGAACTGGGSGSCGPEGCAQVFHAMCDHTCQVDADCPVPSTGDSRPVCQTAFHFCQLPCDDATACPSGYTCQASASWLPQDTNGNPLALPFLCMQTITVTSDGGI